MTLVDVIILVVVVAILASIVYFGIMRKRNNPCAGCAYAKDCVEKKAKQTKSNEKNAESKK